MKGGIGWKLITLALERDPWNVYLKFLSREIDIKLCQFYAKIHIYTISYRNSRFKQLIFSIYATNLKTKISHRKLIFTLVCSNYNFITFIFILIDIIDWVLDRSILWIFTTKTTCNQSINQVCRDILELTLYQEGKYLKYF